MPVYGMSPEEWPDIRNRRILRVLVLTIFVDLVSFSIILPLFPAMLEYYIHREGSAGALGLLVSQLHHLSDVTGIPTNFGVTVLFGGLLASIYSMLQFVCAPFIGALSDKFGRKPVLLISIAGLAASYLMWFVAGRFAMLVMARVLGGIMSGNISTATAAVADVTDERSRSRGMALVGVAFAMGFIVGPAIGGLAAHVDLSAWRPGLAAWGVNPFSTPALVALGFSLLNLVWVAVQLPETRRVGHPSIGAGRRSANPLALFRTEQYPGVTRIILTNFLFLTVFAGMEFSLTFLAVERLNYRPRDNALMFIFIGVLLAVVQGGYVRRRAERVGLRRMAARGLLLTAPGLVLVGQAHSTAMLYAGLTLIAAGPAMVFPCLTALTSLYTPTEEQGRVLGVFRSLGALARAVGPLTACALYWQAGAAATYCAAGAAMLIPFVLTLSLPSAQRLAAPPAPTRSSALPETDAGR